jgi:hypothetical protein
VLPAVPLTHSRGMRRRTVRRAVLLTVAACVSAALGACSPALKDDGSGSRTVPSSSAAEPSSSASATPTSGSSGSTTSTDAAAAALLRRATRSTAVLHSARMTMTSVVGSTRTTVTGQIAYHPVRMDLAISAGGVRLREVLLGSTLYIKLPAGTVPGKPWRSLSLRQLSSFSGLDLAALMNSANADPTVRVLAKAANLRYVGVERLGGSRTRHLTGTVDLDQIFAAMPASEQAAAASLRDMVDTLGVTDDHIDLWVNADDIPVKVTQSYLSSLGRGRSTILLTHLNERTSISAPPRSQVERFPG